MRTIQRPSISTQSPEMLGCYFISTSGAATFPAANDALFLPFTITRSALVNRLFSMNGNVVSGNIDMGIYTLDGTRIVSKGSTAQAGVTAMQLFSISPTLLSPGQYYLAVALDNNTGTLRRFNITVIREQHFGMLKATSSFPLPESVTFATVTAQYIPNIGMDLVGVAP